MREVRVGDRFPVGRRSFARDSTSPGIGQSFGAARRIPIGPLWPTLRIALRPDRFQSCRAAFAAFAGVVVLVDLRVGYGDFDRHGGAEAVAEL